MKTSDYTTEEGYFIRSIYKENYSILWFPAMLALFFTLIAFNQASQNQTILFVALATFFIALGVVIHQISAKLKLSDTELVLEYSLWGNSLLTKHYKIREIKNIRYRQNVKSDNYTSKGHIKVLGKDVTPEEWKTYYYHKEILQFDYKNEDIKIGEYAERFDALIFYELITELQKDNKPKNY